MLLLLLLLLLLRIGLSGESSSSPGSASRAREDFAATPLAREGAACLVFQAPGVVVCEQSVGEGENPRITAAVAGMLDVRRLGEATMSARSQPLRVFMSGSRHSDVGGRLLLGDRGGRALKTFFAYEVLPSGRSLPGEFFPLWGTTSPSSPPLTLVSYLLFNSSSVYVVSVLRGG